MIHVFGSVNVDLVVDVQRLPREGETVIGPGYRCVAGGKGANQALAAARCGARVALSACVGADAFAEPALAELVAGDVELGDLRRVERPTGCAFIAVDREGRNQIVVAAGANRDLRADAAARAVLARAGLLVLQQEAPAEQNAAMLTEARRLGVRTLLNAAPATPLPREVLAAVDVLVVNRHEACLLAGALHLAADDAETAAAALAALTGNTVAVTLGGDGALVMGAGERHIAPAPAVATLDTTAAGDAFTGALAAALLAGTPLATAVARGVAAGSLACTRAGAQPSLPYAAAIDRLLATG